MPEESMNTLHKWPKEKKEATWWWKKMYVICALLSLLTLTSCDTSKKDEVREIRTEKSIDENNDTINTVVYDEGSWSKERINSMEREYFLYYPNSENIKCYCYKGEGEQKFVVYDEQGKILYEELFPGPYVTDSPDESENYDRKWRLIYYENSCKYEISYDDKRHRKTTKITSFDWNITRIIIESESWDIISDEIRGEAGNIIDVKNGGLEKFLKEMNIDTIYRFDATN